MQVPVPKKGDTAELANWRPICLVNTIVKLINAMILNRVRPVVERVLRENQFGFRPERSTNGAQVLLNELLSKSGRGDKFYLAFVDFASAFPSVSHAAIEAALKAFHVGPMLRRLTMSLHSDLEGLVRTPFGKTASFPITSGILQGDVFAPYLFIMVLDRILNAAIDRNEFGLKLQTKGTRKRGYQSTRISDIDYADDLVFVAESKPELTSMIDSLISEASKANLHLAVGQKKTAWMNPNGKTCDDLGSCNASCGLIPRTSSYRHLGNIQHESDPQVTLKERLHLTWACFSKLRGIWISPLGTKTKLRLFDTLVYPIVNYGSSSLYLSKSQIRRADVQINHMRRIVCEATGVDEHQKCYPLESLYKDTTFRNHTSRKSCPPGWTSNSPLFYLRGAHQMELSFKS